MVWTIRLSVPLFLLVALALLTAPHAAAAAQVNVSITDNAFIPQTVTINQGDNITWRNNGSRTHNVTLDNGAGDSGALAPGETFSATFNAPGGSVYRYRYHDSTTGMTGEVIVGSNPNDPANQKTDSACVQAYQSSVAADLEQTRRSWETQHGSTKGTMSIFYSSSLGLCVAIEYLRWGQSYQNINTEAFDAKSGIDLSANDTVTAIQDAANRQSGTIAQASSPQQMNVSMGANYFTPPNVMIRVGDTVVWRNTDTMAHTVTANDGSYDSGTLQPGATYSRMFTTPGTYSYHCQFHQSQGMVGTITVAGGTPSYTPTPGSSYPMYSYPPSPTAPPPSRADQLRAQAQALLARIQQLQAQLAGSTSGSAVTPSVVLDSSSCPLIGRSLKIGSSGDDVTRLQQFLARDYDIYPEGRITGYYGPATEAAVKRWQVKYNIVSSGSPGSTGYGVVGPRTAAAIALLCTTGSYGGVPGPSTPSAPVGGFIQVTPIVGSAPLNVAVQATINTVNSCSGGVYMLDYGDGSVPSQIAVPAGNCQQMIQTLGHQYPYGGTYLVTLSAGEHHTSATVQVYGGSAPTPTPSPTPQPSNSTWGIISVTPVVGGNPLAVSAQVTFPSCSAHSIDWGDGGISTGAAQSGCSSSGTSNATYDHTYPSVGDYTLTLRDGSGVARSSAGVNIVIN